MSARPAGEIAVAARQGTISLIGAVSSAVLGFAFIFVLGQGMGVDASGVALQAVGIFSIVLAVARLGADTTALWLLPRLRHEGGSLVPAGLGAVLLPSVVGPLVVTAGWLMLLAVRAEPVFGPQVDRSLTWSAAALPAASVMFTALAATRAFGSVKPFVLIQMLSVPAGRLVLVLVITLVGGGGIAAAAGWSAVFLPAAVLAVVVLLGTVRRALPNAQRLVELPDRHLLGRAVRFGLPRTVSAAAEQATVWLGAVLVGIAMDNAAAGQFGSASRFVGAGIVVATAVRTVVAPRFSALLAQGKLAEVQELYSVTARWVLLFGSPIYVVLAVNATTVMGGLGDDFTDGARAMAIMCSGTIVLLAAGNVQSLLLMSGGSSLAAVNKIVSILVLTAGTLLLVPRLGLEGAAIAWTAATLLDVALAALQVRRSTGLALAPVQIAGLVAVVVSVTAVPCVLAILVLGPGLPALLSGAVLAGAGVLSVLWVGRGPLHLDELASVFGGRRSQRSDEPTTMTSL